TSVVVSGGTIPGATPADPGRCEIAVDVVAPAPGVFEAVLTAGAVTSSRGNLSVNVGASLTCHPRGSILGTKTFSPDIIHGDPGSDRGESRVTITLTNPNDFTLHDIDFTDQLPIALIIAGPPRASTNCRGGSLHTPRPGDTSIAMSDGQLRG